MSVTAQLGDAQLGELLLGGVDPGAVRETTIHEALRRKLMDACEDAVIERTVKVYYKRRPESANDFPCIVFDKDDEQRLDCLTEAATVGTYAYSINIISPLPEETTEISRAVRVGIVGDGENDAGQFPFYMLGRKCTSAWLDGESDDVDGGEDDSDDWIYVTNQTYSLIVED